MGKILQHWHNIFAIGKAHRGRNRYERGREPGVQGAGGGKFSPPCPPPPPHITAPLLDGMLTSIAKLFPLPPSLNTWRGGGGG